MRISDFTRRALRVCVAALLLAGCGGSQEAPALGPPTAGAPTTRTGPEPNDVFTATYNGDYTGNACEKGRADFDFAGGGDATFLGLGAEFVHIHANGRKKCTWTGHATLTSFRYSDEIHMKLSLGEAIDPCEQRLSWTTTGGTGRFKGARGEGTVFIECEPNNTYVDAWTGYVTYHK